MYIVKCNCCGGQSSCDELELPAKWTSFAVKVSTHDGTGCSKELESEDLHACADCSSNMTPDEMCEAISEILRREMNQAEMAKVGSDKIDLEDLPPGQIERLTTGLNIEVIIADAMQEVEIAIRRMHSNTGGAHVHLDRKTKSYPRHPGGIQECPTGEITLTVTPEK